MADDDQLLIADVVDRLAQQEDRGLCVTGSPAQRAALRVDGTR